jgi:hypothetical protein
MTFASATASAPAPTLHEGVNDTTILGVAPTTTLDNPLPPFPNISSGAIGVGGGGKGKGFLDDAFKDPEPDPECVIIARPAPAYATTVSPSLFLIDGLGGHNEQEDEELILLALHRFGWLGDNIDLQVA